ncbi:ankyrin repeat-containing protein, partial [Tanacetum coccineum]
MTEEDKKTRLSTYVLVCQFEKLASSAGASEFDETYNSILGPRFLDGSPVVLTNSNGASRSSLTERIDEINSSPELDEALKRIQLSLEHAKDNGLSPFCVARGSLIIHQRLNLISVIIVLDIAQDQLNTSRNGATDFERLHQYQQTLKDDSTVSSQQNYIWKDVLTYDGDAAYDGSLQNYMYPSDTNKCFYSSISTAEEQGKHHSGDAGTSYNSSILPSQELEDSPFPTYIPTRNMYQNDAEIYSTLFDQGQNGTSRFRIKFNHCTRAEGGTCPLGPPFVSAHGVISCHAPPHTPGKVTICITSGNREACSEVREFEYRDKPHMHMHNTSTENEISRSSEELRLLVRFVQMLLSDKIGQKGSEDSWTQIIEAFTDDSPASSRTTNWLLEELLKDKLETWLSFELQDNNTCFHLSKGEQGIIHMVSGLGFVWALAHILKSGVGINFRDANGWTALHWASRFGKKPSFLFMPSKEVGKTKEAQRLNLTQQL